MILASLAVAILHAAGASVSRCDGSCAIRGDTLDLVLPYGGSACTVASGSPDTVCVQAVPEARAAARTARSKGRNGPRWVRQRAFPRRVLELEVRATGAHPTDPGIDLRAVGYETTRLLAALSVDVRLRRGRDLRVPRSAWDRNGNGRLDLWRDEGPGQASDEELRLSGALRDSSVRLPALLLFQDSLRLGWPLAGPVRAGDTLLRLASGRALPWRDPAGRTRRYLLEGPSGERRDTFAVDSYLGETLRIRAGGVRGGWRRDHPADDLVVRPGVDFPAFGTVDRSDPRASPVLFIEPGAMADPVRCARVLARELGHAAGLADRPSPGNLMSALLRMDVENPVLEPAQAAAFRDSLDRLVPEASPVPRVRVGASDW